MDPNRLPRGVSEWAMTALLVVLVFFGVFQMHGGLPPPPPPPPSMMDGGGSMNAARVAMGAGGAPGAGAAQQVPLSIGAPAATPHNIIADIKARRNQAAL